MKKTVIVVSALFLFMILFFTISSLVQTREETEAVGNEKETPEKETETASQLQFIGDTVYTGEKVIEREVFLYPFQKGGKYQPNKELIKTMESAEVSFYLQNAEDYFVCLYDFKYRNFIADAESYPQRLSQMYVADYMFPFGKAFEGKEYYVREFAEFLMDWAVKNQVNLEAGYRTDASLIWKDGGIVYVRGILDITVFSQGDIGILQKLLQDEEITNGKKESYLFDLGFAIGDGGIKVVTVEKLGKLERKES